LSSKTPAKSPALKKDAQKIATPPRDPTPAPDGPAVGVAPEAKHEAQIRRKLAVQEAALRRERQQSIRTLGLLIAMFIVVGGGALAFYLQEALKPPPPPPPPPPLPPPGQEVPIMPSYHLVTGDEPHPTYTTDPPTSGPHIGQLADWGVHTDVITKELAVHSLEDGGVNVNYRPDLDKATVSRLAALVQSYADLITQGSEDHHVLMYPYPGLSNAIVLTAWRHIDRLDKFDEARIKRFIDAYSGIDHHQESGDRPGGTPTPGP
jgi:Protein of unknown function (DUF3105)